MRFGRSRFMGEGGNLILWTVPPPPPPPGDASGQEQPATPIEQEQKTAASSVVLVRETSDAWIAAGVVGLTGLIVALLA